MSVDIYHLYKPLRNYLSQFDCVQSLINLWRYSSHLSYDTPLLPQQELTDGMGRRVQLREKIFPWDLDLLVREIILNAGNRGFNFGHQNELIKAVKHLRHIDNEISILRRNTDSDEYNVLFEMHRMGNRQFPFQERPNLNSLIRHHKINSNGVVEPIVVKEVGLDLRDLFCLGITTTGSFHQRPIFDVAQNFTVIGIDNKKRDHFFGRMTCNLRELKEELKSLAVYDDGWLFTWNPLVQKPLISFDSANPHLVLCPIPSHFSNRFSKGIYYDIVNQEGFDNAYGASFQSYVGEVIHTLCSTPEFTITPERTYHDGKGNLKHGVDWIVTDSTAHLFIECKTKRLTLKSKTAAKSEDVSRDLDVMAGYIVQHYKNILDAEQGKTDWILDDKPRYFLMITLDHWWLFSPILTEALADRVRKKLIENQIEESIIERIPYTIASISEFEECFETMVVVGINRYLSIKTDDVHRSWLPTSFTRTEFASYKPKRNTSLFESELEAMLPKITA